MMVGETDRWPDLKIQIARPLVRIEPGDYEGITVELTAFRAFRRRNLRLDFDIFNGPAENGRIIARLPLFIRLPERKLSAASKLVRLFRVLGIPIERPDRLPLNSLRGKLCRVLVDDAQKDSEGLALTEATRYSVIRQVRERLA